MKQPDAIGVDREWRLGFFTSHPRRKLILKVTEVRFIIQSAYQHTHPKHTHRTQTHTHTHTTHTHIHTHPTNTHTHIQHTHIHTHIQHTHIHTHSTHIHTHTRQGTDTTTPAPTTTEKTLLLLLLFLLRQSFRKNPEGEPPLFVRPWFTLRLSQVVCDTRSFF